MWQLSQGFPAFRAISFPTLASALLLAGAVRGEATDAQNAKARPTNRLAQESSPYLLQHAHNPVDWFPWGTEAFAKARKEGKMVFLSIGYSSCHWCHVMERESFENPDVAKLLNQWFVCIKVDREERPDIDSVYMTALNVLGNQGGWPLSMFLTGDGKPIVGGTYWPPDDRQVQGGTLRGFKTILQVMHDWQTQKPAELDAQAQRLATATRAALAEIAPGTALVDLDQKLVDGAVAALKEEFDSEHGGFASRARQFRGPKFPVPCYLQLLLHEAGRSQSGDAAGMLDVTLEHMARGGVYDQVGGGFHRYSTDRTWTVPHFEKMLYDNAQLAEVYAEAYRQTRKPLYRRVLQETLAFVEREMTAPEGAFYSALDADTEGGEGLFYVWSDEQLDAALPDRADSAFLRKVYGAEGTPNFESKYRILCMPRPGSVAAGELGMSEDQLQARLNPLRQKLLQTRALRPRPFLDTKILAGWNGQMIAGYAKAGQVLHEPGYLQTAVRAANFILVNLRGDDGRLRRSYHPAGKNGEARPYAYLDDYAYLAHGLLCLHDATGDGKWLTEAKRVTDTMVQYYADTEAGGFFYTAGDQEKLFARTKDQFDSAQPSGNSAAARNLVELHRKTGDSRYRDLAEKTEKCFAAALKTNPAGLTGMAHAVALGLEAGAGKPVRPPADLLAQGGGARKSDAVVKIEGKANPEKPGADGKQEITLTLTMDPGWHIYANPPGQEDLNSVQTTVTVKSKAKPAEFKVQYPEATVINDPTIGAYKVYEGTVTIKATLLRAAGDTGPLEVTVKFQSCNDKQCLLPASKIIKLPE